MSSSRVKRTAAADLWPDYPAFYNGPRDEAALDRGTPPGDLASSDSTTPASTAGSRAPSSRAQSAAARRIAGPSSAGLGGRRTDGSGDDRHVSSAQRTKRKSDGSSHERAPKRPHRAVEAAPAGLSQPSGSRAHRAPVVISDSSEEDEDVEVVSVGRAAVRNVRRDGSSRARAALPKKSHKAVRAYVPSPDEVRESESLVIVGEDNESSAYDDAHHKPIRMLDDFAVFDPSHGLRLVSLGTMEDADGPPDRQWEAAGIVGPVFVDEDAAAEFEDAEEDGEGGSALQRVRLSAILRFTIDYTKEHDPIYIETVFAWYILKGPSRRYESFFVDFYKTHKIPQAVLSAALIDPGLTASDFVRSFVGSRSSILKEPFSKADLKAAIPDIKHALEMIDEMEEVASTPLLRTLLKTSTPVARKPHRAKPPSRPPLRKTHHTRPRIGNIDRQVLLRENQNPTCVTPRIANLAAPFFRDLVVEGYPLPRTVADGVAEKTVLTDPDARAYLQKLLDKTHGPPARILFAGQPVLKQARRNGGATYTRSVVIDDIVYQIGDVVITPAGDDGRKKAPELPAKAEGAPKATVGDFFWFGKILSLRMEDLTAHIQWFQHGRKTVMEDLAHPQELFVTDLCDDLALVSVVGKANVKKLPPGERPPRLDYNEFFYSLSYLQAEASFQDITDHDQVFQDQLPPDNCPFCLIAEEKMNEVTSSRLCENGTTIGFTLRGIKYHCWDSVRIRKENGPCLVGQIEAMVERDGVRHNDPFIVTVRLFGRAMLLKHDQGQDAVPVNPDEDRHLFLTEELLEVNSHSLLGLCFVLHKQSVRDMKTWLALSPYHFYVSSVCPSTETRSWADSTKLPCKNFAVCGLCMKEKLVEADMISTFEQHVEPLRIFDPFGGVGAFGLGMARAGCMKTTHAIEISPSAAKTLRLNSPETIVYNQCANLVLEHAIKLSRGVESTLLSLEDEEPLPPPPKAEDIDCIVAGFPCQPHSTLNMFQRAVDKKSDLILSPLAWIDHLRPKYCLFENVRGFLKFNLNATQAGRHRVEGGIEIGGLKFLVRALVTLGYQLRFGLLQAAHYGTPQTRVRFFLFAARHGYPLPALPQPTHDFPKPDSLEIRLTTGDVLAPIDTGAGIAVHDFVTIGGAISDLQRWDWRNPHQIYKRVQEPPEERGRNVIVIECLQEYPWCGLEGRIPYQHLPRTPFQARCREQATSDLQHYTRCLKPEIVERVANIPLKPGSDYRSLKPKLWEWQAANPSSANARRGYPAGLYGRLDADSYFPTTVTNVEPTAKQSRVLNPWCKRTVTVRELARSQGFPDHFKFFSLNNDVKMMHRQIGNAVAWPVGEALGRELREAMFKKWQSDRMLVDEADDEDEGLYVN